MKKIALSLLITLAVAAPVNAAMMWNSTNVRPAVVLRYINPDAPGAVVTHSYPTSGAAFFELDRDTSNRHLLFVRAENSSGMALNIYGLGMGARNAKGGIDLVLCQQANLPAPQVDFGNGMILTPDSVNMQGAYTPGDLASGSITITLVGTLNFFGSNVPAIVTLTPTFRSLPRKASSYSDADFTSNFIPNPVINVPPAAVNKSYPVNFGTNQPIDFLAGAVSNQQDGLLSVSVKDGPSNGTLSSIISGKATYRPNPGFGGADVVHFTVIDSAGLESAQYAVTLTVSSGPQAKDIIQKVERDSANNIVNFSSLGLGPGVRVSGINTIPGVTTGAFGGSVPNFTYTPAKGFAGTDRFTYTLAATDTAFTATSNVTMQVCPVAADDFFVFDRALGLSQNIDVLANDFDTNGNNSSLTIKEMSAPKHGTLINNGTSITYTTDNLQAWTEDSFTYTVTDSSNKTGTGIVRIFYKPQ